MKKNTNPEKALLTRRDALQQALLACMGMTAVQASSAAASSEVPTAVEPPFVPENDYPFFGCDTTDLSAGLRGEVQGH